IIIGECGLVDEPLVDAGNQHRRAREELWAIALEEVRCRSADCDGQIELMSGKQRAQIFGEGAFIAGHSESGSLERVLIKIDGLRRLLEQLFPESPGEVGERRKFRAKRL